MGLASKILKRASYLGDSRWVRFYAQRRFLSESVRESVADWLVKYRPHSHANENSTVQDKAKAVAQELRGKGIVPMGQLLDEAQCLRLRDYFQNQKVRDVYRENLAPFAPFSDERADDCHIAHHDAKDVVKAPDILALANHTELLAAAEAFLGCKPTISYMAAWWSYPTNMGPQQAENYHRDVDDWRFLKFFIYLTDVDENNGPHFYVTDSAGSEKLRKIERFEDSEVKSAFGGQSTRCVTGTAGTGFLENTFGIHKGLPVKSGHRLIFQVVYSINPLPYGPRQPVLNAKVAEVDDRLDEFVNRIYLKF